MGKLDGLMRRLGYARFDEIERQQKAEAKSAIEELKDAISRALNIVSVHNEARKILSDAVGSIDAYAQMDIDVYKSQADTLPAIEVSPPTLRTGEVST